MFENYREMSAEEKAQVKSIHNALRKETYNRAGNLAWGFVRGFPYRRIERTTRTQHLADGQVIKHNPPPLSAVAALLKHYLPAFPIAKEMLTAWADNPDGAIPAPSPRAKKPYTREVA